MAIYFSNTLSKEPFQFDSVGNHWLQEGKKKDKKKDKLIKKKKQQKMLKISHMFKIQLKRLMTFLIKGKLTRRLS